jgi:hypothetical protein
MRASTKVDSFRRRRTWRRDWRSFLVAALAAAAVFVPSCTVPSLNLAGKKECATASDCTPGQTCTSAGNCVSSEGGVEGSPVPEGSTSMDLCTGIPHYLGPESVGGFETDFSSVPNFNYPTLPTSTNLAAQGDTLTFDARVGWSDAGLHVLIHVIYMTGVVAPPGIDEPVWYGDAAELFLKGNSIVTGAFGENGMDGGLLDPGALHIATSPDATRTQAYDSDAIQIPLGQGVTVASRMDTDGGGVSTGYTLEYLVAWQLLLGPDESPPTMGSRIAFDFGVDYRYRSLEAGTNQPEDQYGLYFGSSHNKSCMNGTPPTPLPPCDDGTWCTPVLDP